MVETNVKTITQIDLDRMDLIDMAANGDTFDLELEGGDVISVGLAQSGVEWIESGCE